MVPFAMRLIILLLLVAFGGAAHAGYAVATPPNGFAGTQPGAMFWNRIASNAPYVGGSAAANVTMNVGGRAVVMPVSMRLAANAASYAVAAARATPAGLATGALATWLLGFGLEYAGGQWVKQSPPSYTARCGATGFVGSPTAAGLSCLQQSAYQGWGAGNATGFTQVSLNRVQNPDGTWRFDFTGSYYGCASGECRYFRIDGFALPQVSEVPGGAVPAVEQDWSAPTAATTLPDAVANQLEGVPLPVLRPVLNPDANGDPMPLRVPLGVPTAVPNTNPQQWQQPVADIVPYVQGDPFSVDIQTKTVPSPDAVGQTVPQNNPTTVGTPAQQVELETCGLPGRPPCKIDETGTPQVPENTNQQKVDSATQAIKDFIANPTSIVPEFPQLNWSFQLPTGCAAIDTPAFAAVGLASIDICQFQPMFHELMSIVWVLGGLFGAISLFVRNALSNG